MRETWEWKECQSLPSVLLGKEPASSSLLAPSSQAQVTSSCPSHLEPLMSIFAWSTRSVTHSLSWPQSFEKGTWRGEEGPRLRRRQGERTGIGRKVKREERVPRSESL